MYASIRKYQVAADSAGALAVRVEDGFVPMISKLPGFVSYQVVDAGDGTVLSISVYEDRESAERSDEAARHWVAEALAEEITAPPEITAGEIVVAAPRPAVW